jgi:hypothetical protein
MNKPLLFPLSILICLTIVGYLSNGNLVGDGFTTDTNGTVDINGTTGSYSSSYGGVFTFDFFTGDGLLVTIIVLVSAVILLGIGLFGSGLSVFSQNLVLQSVVYLGAWGALTIMSKDFILVSTGIIGIILYFILTIMYGIGFIMQVTSSSGE